MNKDKLTQRQKIFTVIMAIVIITCGAAFPYFARTLDLFSHDEKTKKHEASISHKAQMTERQYKEEVARLRKLNPTVAEDFVWLNQPRKERVIKTPFLLIASHLSQLYNSGLLNLKDLEKIDFSRPGDDGFGEGDIAYQIFNPASMRYMKKDFKTGFENLKAHTNGTPKIFYVLYNFGQSPNSNQGLYAVVANIASEYCSGMYRQKFQSGFKPPLEKHSKGAINVGRKLPYMSREVCVNAPAIGWHLFPTKQWYLFTNLRHRPKKAEDAR